MKTRVYLKYFVKDCMYSIISIAICCEILNLVCLKCLNDTATAETIAQKIFFFQKSTRDCKHIKIILNTVEIHVFDMSTVLHGFQVKSKQKNRH